MERAELAKAIEGILFAMGDSVEIDKMAAALAIDESEVVEIVDALAAEYEKDGRGIRITKLEQSYQMCTAPEIYDYLIQIAKQPKKAQLTDVLLETLSIIAYKQPVTKAEIEKIRGVSCGHVISRLVDYRLVEEIGRIGCSGTSASFWDNGGIFTGIWREIIGGAADAESGAGGGIQAAGGGRGK